MGLAKKARTGLKPMLSIAGASSFRVFTFAQEKWITNLHTHTTAPCIFSKSLVCMYLSTIKLFNNARVSLVFVQIEIFSNKRGACDTLVDNIVWTKIYALCLCKINCKTIFISTNGPGVSSSCKCFSCWLIPAARVILCTVTILLI